MAKFLLSAFADEASKTLDGQIAALQRNNMKYIEIRNVDGKGILDCTDEELAAIHSKLEAAGIGVSAIGSPIGKIKITDPFEPHIEAFRRALNAAKVLGTKNIRMFSFFIPEGEDAAKYKDEVFRRLEVLVEMAEKEGILCCHENEKEIYGDIDTRSIEICKHFAGRMKGIFDPANYVQCGMHPAEFFDEIYPYLEYMHIKDAMLEDGAVVPSGKGDGHVPELVAKFAKAEGERFLTVQPHLKVFDGLQNLQGEELKHRYSYASSDEAFDAAVAAIKEILNAGGYDYQ